MIENYQQTLARLLPRRIFVAKQLIASDKSEERSVQRGELISNVERNLRESQCEWKPSVCEPGQRRHQVQDRRESLT